MKEWFVGVGPWEIWGRSFFIVRTSPDRTHTAAICGVSPGASVGPIPQTLPRCPVKPGMTREGREPGSRSVPSLPPGVAAEVLLLDGLALVEFPLAAGQGDVELGVAVLGDEKAGGHDGQALLLDGALQFAELPFGEQQLAVAAGILAAERGAPPVFRDIHILHIEFPVHEMAPAVHQRGLARADRLDLRPVQDDAGRERLEKFILEPGPLVADLNGAFFLFLGHLLLKCGVKVITKVAFLSVIYYFCRN